MRNLSTGATRIVRAARRRLTTELCCSSIAITTRFQLVHENTNDQRTSAQTGGIPRCPWHVILLLTCGGARLSVTGWHFWVQFQGVQISADEFRASNGLANALSRSTARNMAVGCSGSSYCFIVLAVIVRALGVKGVMVATLKCTCPSQPGGP